MQSSTRQLPPRAEMVRAYLERDASYDGAFVTAVKTTGIFCHPSCAARKPRPENVEFFPRVADALAAGYRPCKRCRPIEAAGATPDWLQPLLRELDRDPARVWRARDLRALGLQPARVARWFKQNHGVTFHSLSRARRLAVAMDWIRRGTSVTNAAFGSGYESLSGFNEAFRQFAGGPPSRSRGTITVCVDQVTTPLGTMIAAATDKELVLLEFADRRMLPLQVRRVERLLDCVFAPRRNEILRETQRQLDEYFAGGRTEFTIPIGWYGTEFQCEVWRALTRLPAGSRCSYQQLAGVMGRPRSVRAVGRANGDNRIAILIPCHRVVGSDGKLTGYGGGLWRKQRLLELESAAILPAEPS